jgi:aspartyl/asparaginyl beta-hydroxylase (cupin superfamily)
MSGAPNPVAAQIRLGDERSAAGNDDVACYHYRTALRLAQLLDLPTAEVEQARQALATIETRNAAKREGRLSQRGLPAGKRSAGLKQALEIAAGTKRHYVQEPTCFTYPGLPSIQFFDTAQFEWAPAMEASTSTIRAEFVDFLQDQGHADFRAYIQDHTVAPEADQTLKGSKDWSVLSLCENGWLAPKIVEHFPKTWETVLRAPMPRIAGWGPTVVFSLLRAGARIAPHTGMFNTRLICHLPLIVPEGCEFRVGNEVRQWEEGKLIIFDDTIEHEARNDSSQDRIVLIFDVWRPELTEQERYELTALFSD